MFFEKNHWEEIKLKKRIGLLILTLLLLVSFTGCTIYKENLSLDSINDFEEIEVKEEEIIVEPEEPEEPEEPIILNMDLLAAGDIMFHSPQYQAAYNAEDKTYDFTPVFKHVEKYIQEADIALANFETVTAGEEIQFSGYPRFNTPKESLFAIKEAGFDILSTANNHTLDQGKKGLIGTIEMIEEYGLKNIGTYREADEDILVEDINGIVLGFLSYTYGLNGMDGMLTTEELSYMVNLIDEEKIKKDIEKTKELGVDLTVVTIHWGNEYHEEPSEYQIILGGKMIDWGADIILGSHPHVIQKSEIVDKDGKDKFIIYSMGNYLSNQRYERLNNYHTEDGIMIKLNIEKNFESEETIIKEVEYIPTWVNKYSNDGKMFYEILPVKDALENEIEVIGIENLKVRLEKSYEDTMGKMHQK